MFPHARSIWTISSIGAEEEKKRIPRNQDASCLVRNAGAQLEPLITHHTSRAGRNSEMLSISRGKRTHQLLTDLGFVLSWSLSPFFFLSFFFSSSAGFSWQGLFGGTMISLFLSTFIYSLVSMQHLAVGVLSGPILVHLLDVRLKPLKCAASWFLIAFLEALQL